MAGVKGRSGGSRGGGRPRKDVIYAEPIANANELIAADLDAAVKRQIAFAKAGDRAANEYLINRIMGKPTEKHEHDIDSEIAGLLEELSASA